MKTKMEPFKHSITFNNKRYIYTIKPVDHEMVFFECKDAGIAQEFLAEDIPALIMDLPELILIEKRFQKKRKEMLRFRISPEDKNEIQKRAAKAGYNTISAFLRDLGLGQLKNT